MNAKFFMKKYVVLSAIATTALLFTLSAKPETVTSSTAMSIDEVRSEVLRIEAYKNSIPTMPPFPSIEVRVPEYQYAEQLRISVSSRPRPTMPSAVSTVTPTPSPTTEVVPTQLPATPRSSATTQPILTPVSIPTIVPTSSPTVKPTATPTAKPATAPTTAPVQESNPTLTDEVIKLVNSERAKVNLGALTKNSALTSSAQKYAQYMANSNFFSHNGEDGSTFITRNKAAGYTNYTWMGENIAAGQGSAQAVMNDWMNSSGHKANILNSKAKEIGVGYATNSSSTYKRYWAQEFGAR